MIPSNISPFQSTRLTRRKSAANHRTNLQSEQQWELEKKRSVAWANPDERMIRITEGAVVGDVVTGAVVGDTEGDNVVLLVGAVVGVNEG
eukprot:CAMPEP_0194414822 /NCGR_PEP_ID=MMETSP0176-20130528/13575_1 /TAXON_ID=216777 /ORGANISM="Proboscia alata, Strain PI-D3" /LENGTH=89 /DNA_ID=CAMNT_0039219119 /DNA_START=195 /DNA_END=460 /DNA_ORIENTATION=+